MGSSDKSLSIKIQDGISSRFEFKKLFGDSNIAISYESEINNLEYNERIIGSLSIMYTICLAIICSPMLNLYNFKVGNLSIYHNWGSMIILIVAYLYCGTTSHHNSVSPAKSFS